MALTGVAVVAGLAALCLGGCANLGYYWQSASGHLALMNASRPVNEWLADTATPDTLKARLALSQRIRDFAATELHLPDNPSYRRYADLKRRAAVWNVVAAPPYSLTLHTWCFPVTGCVGYRGYFKEADARAEAARLSALGLEASVYGVPAYSTLGWMNWAGGDPLLNTFMHYPEGELARLIFHELAHQVVYAKDDTMFNESFATAVERLGGARWLAAHASDAARAEYAAQRRHPGRREAIACGLDIRMRNVRMRSALRRLIRFEMPAQPRAACIRCAFDDKCRSARSVVQGKKEAGMQQQAQSLRGIGQRLRST